MSSFISNAFMLPNDLIDEGYMAQMKGAALPCYLFIARKTRGWNKTSDSISLSQLINSTGYKKDAVLAGVELLISMGIIKRVSYANRPAKYTLTDKVVVGKTDSKTNSTVGKTDSRVGKTDSTQSEKTTHNNNIKTTNKKTNSVFSFSGELKNLGAEELLISDWLIVRKGKGAKNTQTAFTGFKRELDKSGLDVNTALRICIERNWQGFNAGWLNNINLAEYQIQIPAKHPESVNQKFTPPKPKGFLGVNHG